MNNQRNQPDNMSGPTYPAPSGKPKKQNNSRGHTPPIGFGGLGAPGRPTDPTPPSGPNNPSIRRKARRSLKARLRYGAAASGVPSQQYGRLSAFPISAPAGVRQSSHHGAAMLRHGVTYDTAKLTLQAESIHRFMMQYVTIPEQVREIVANVSGVEDLDELSERLADTAKDHPRVVRLALGGKLRSAVRAMPALGTFKDGVRFTEQMEKELFELLVDVSSWLLFAALCQRARAAQSRFFEPTGISALDRQDGNRATTAGHVARALEYNSGWIGYILSLYWLSKDGPVTPEMEHAINSVPGLADHGRRELARLEAIHGGDLPAIVEEWQRAAWQGNRRIRRMAVAVQRRTHGNMTLSHYNGEDALKLLFLACLQTCAWKEETLTKAEVRIWEKEHGRTWDKRNDEDLPKHSNIYRALLVIRQGGTPKPTAMPARASVVARELFAVVRSLVTNDPEAWGFTGRDKPVDFDAFEAAYWEQNARKAGGGKRGQEAYRADCLKGFRKIYDEARKRGNKALLEEVHGTIWRQLHL